MSTHRYRHGALVRGDAIAALETLENASVRLVYCDGPYGLGKGEWDRAIGPALVDWYAPHFDAWDRVLMPSCSLVVWGTTRSWAYLHVELERRGWEQAGQIVWSKGNATTAMRSDPDVLRSWPQTHEIVGIYLRCGITGPASSAATIQNAAGADDRNWIRLWIRDEWAGAGLTQTQANTACGVASMAKHYFSSSQWALPTWEHYQRLAAFAAEHGAPLPAERDGRPWLAHPAAHDLQGSLDHLRAEFEAARPPFNIGSVAPSVWQEAPPTLGAARHGHECEKPVSITRRLIEVLTLPGEMVFEPFGGSSPVARVCEAMPQGQERRWLSCEIDAGHVAATRAMLAATQGRLL